MPNVPTGAAFFAVLRPLFGGSLDQPQVDGLTAIVGQWNVIGDGDDRKLAYLLGTAFHETARTMQPIYERGARTYFAKYEPGTPIGKRLGNTEKGDGYLFRGRGYVQLTGRANYIRAGKELRKLPGIVGDLPLLVDAPDDAMKDEAAGAILILGCLQGWFTTKKLGDYITPGAADYRNARRVVNGTDKAEAIADFAETFEAAIRAERHATNEATVAAQLPAAVEEALAQPVSEPIAAAEPAVAVVVPAEVSAPASGPPLVTGNGWAAIAALFLSAAAGIGALLSKLPGVLS